MTVKFGSFYASTGPQSITGVGFQPQLVFLFHANRVNEESTPVADFAHCFSVITPTTYIAGTPPYPSFFFSESYTSAAGVPDNSIQFELSEPSASLWTQTDANVSGSFDLGLSAALTSDGFDVDWDSYVAAPILIYYLAISEAQSYLTNTFDINGANTGFGFEPNAMMMWGVGRNLGIDNRYHSSFGIATDPLKQYTISNADSLTPSNAYSSVESGQILKMYNGLDDPSDNIIQLVSFDSDGLKLTSPSFYSSFNYAFALLALRFENGVDSGIFNTQTKVAQEVPTMIEPEGLVIISNTRNEKVGVTTGYYDLTVGFVDSNLSGGVEWLHDHDKAGSHATSTLTDTRYHTYDTDGGSVVTAYAPLSFIIDTSSSTDRDHIFLAIGKPNETGVLKIKNDMEMPPLAIHYMSAPHRNAGVGRAAWTVLLYKNGEYITDVPVDVLENPSKNYTFFFQNDGDHEAVWSLIAYETASPNLKYTESWIVKKKITEKNVKFIRSRMDSESGYFQGNS